VIAGAVDIGTNTVLLVVAARDGGGGVRVLAERATITRLGQDVDRTRRIAPEAAERTLACLARYAEEMTRLGVERRAAVGTSALRDAGGGAELVDRAERLLGVRPRVIDGLEEAELGFAGATSGLGLRGRVTVFDVGGGSTEIITGTLAEPPVIERATSLDLGSVRLTERCVRTDPPSSGELGAVRGEVRAALTALVPPPPAPLVGVAGTVTTLAAISQALDSYDAGRVHGSELDRDEVERLLDRLAALPLAQRKALPGLEPARADVIVAGAVLVAEVLAWSGAECLVVSDRGVRWGLLMRLLLSRRS
jgi:exopolyphosphatase/guanosine-5'-triphosphate,3'-diphosphate pyrophosphatase